ncbi:MAG: OmpH family outer membrane protein [Acidobacteria bacterium]|nr:OmpH family outer membrane protein [Acidobacteriota bacterium]
MIGESMVPAAVLAALLAAPAGAETSRIAVFDQAQVFEKTALGRKMREELSGLRDRKRKEIDGREEELRGLREKYEREKLNMTEERRAEMERQIDRMLRDLQRMDEDASREMRTQLNDYQERFQREIFTVVEVLGREQGFTLILEKSVLFYHDPGLDITDLVVRKFNEVHPASP